MLEIINKNFLAFSKVFTNAKLVNIPLGIMLLLTFLVLEACVKEPDIIVQEDLRAYCPKCSDTITWDSYGIWEIGTGVFNKRGVYNNVISTDLKVNCNWKNYEGDGPINKTIAYQAQSDECSTGVIFEWGGSGFDAFYLSAGWDGSTSAGIRIGDSLGLFLSTYPEFERNERDTLEYNYESPNNRAVKAIFNTEKQLTNLFIQ